jgi:hypothetical protein
MEDYVDEYFGDVPIEYWGLFMSIVDLTDPFCRENLNEDYLKLCREMALELCQEGTPATTGKPVSWASAIVHAVGWVNFLSDPATEPYMSTEELARSFGVSKGNMMAKSKILRDGLDLMPFHPEWCTTDMLKHNPLVWMVEVNGLPMDIRTAPREIQEQAYQQGIIPYIPGPEDMKDLVFDDESDDEDFDDEWDDDDFDDEEFRGKEVKSKDIPPPGANIIKFPGLTREPEKPKKKSPKEPINEVPGLFDDEEDSQPSS